MKIDYNSVSAVTVVLSIIAGFFNVRESTRKIREEQTDEINKEYDIYQMIKTLNKGSDSTNSAIAENLLNNINLYLINDFLENDRKSYQYAHKCQELSTFLLIMAIVISPFLALASWQGLIPLAFILMAFWLAGRSVHFGIDYSQAAIKYDSEYCMKHEPVIFISDEEMAKTEKEKSACVIDIRTINNDSDKTVNNKYYNMDYKTYHNEKGVRKYVSKSTLDKESTNYIIVGINYERCYRVAKYLANAKVKVCAIAGPTAKSVEDIIVELNGSDQSQDSPGRK